MCLGVFKAEIFLFPFLKFLSLPLNSDSCIEALNQLEAADDILVKIFDFVKNPLVFIADFWNWGQLESPRKWDEVFLGSILEDLKRFRVAFFNFLPGFPELKSEVLLRVISDLEYFNLPALYLLIGFLSSPRFLLGSMNDLDSLGLIYFFESYPRVKLPLFSLENRFTFF